jgi:ribosomal protein S12 methylthiotransferase
MIVASPVKPKRDFNELCQFVEAAQFDRMGAFSYSGRDTSKSFALDAKVYGRTIQKRKRKLWRSSVRFPARAQS